MKNRIQYFESKYEAILKSLRNQDEISYYTGSILLLAGLMIITLLGIFIKDNYSVRLLLFLAVLIVSMLVYKSKISRKSLSSDTSKSTNTDESLAALKSNLSLLSQTLESRHSRVSAVKWFYIFNFPIFLSAIKEFISGHISTKFLIFSLLITFLIGLLVWQLFFREDLKKIEEHQLSVSQMINDLS